MFRIIICVFLILIAFPLYGQRILDIPYVQFEISENWRCKSFGPHWVCDHRFSDAEKPAMIVVTGHLKNTSDTENVYSQMFGNEQLSSATPVTINRQTWMEVFENQSGGAGSAISRYVGTVCCEKMPEKVYILIRFYASEESYSKYHPQFLRSIRSLKLPSNLRKTFIHLRAQTPEERRDMMIYMANLFSEEDEFDVIENNSKPDFVLWTKFLAGGLLLVFGFLFYIYYKKRKRKKYRRRKRRKKTYRRR